MIVTHEKSNRPNGGQKYNSCDYHYEKLGFMYKYIFSWQVSLIPFLSLWAATSRGGRYPVNGETSGGTALSRQYTRSFPSLGMGVGRMGLKKSFSALDVLELTM